jgi:hypothetical protein
MADTPLAEGERQSEETRDPHSPSAVDATRVAERVYRLMMDEVRLARARGAGGGTRPGGVTHGD